MTRLIGAAARDAWRRWRSNREVILAIAGVFVFLPMFALLLLVPEPITPEKATQQQKVEIVSAWLTNYLPGLALRIGFELFATTAIISFYLLRNHVDVRSLLGRAFRLLPRFCVGILSCWGLITLCALPALVMALSSTASSIGLVPIMMLPALYVYGRIALTGPVIVAEPEMGVASAIARSVALTHGNGWRIFGLLALPIVAGYAALAIIDLVNDALGSAGSVNPVAKAAIDGIAALAATASGVARILLQVSLYKRLTSPRHGI